MNVSIVENCEVIKIGKDVFRTHTVPNECFGLIGDIYFFGGELYPEEITRGSLVEMTYALDHFKRDCEYSNLRVVDCYTYTVGPFAWFLSPWADIDLEDHELPYHARRVVEESELV